MHAFAVVVETSLGAGSSGAFGRCLLKHGFLDLPPTETKSMELDRLLASATNGLQELRLDAIDHDSSNGAMARTTLAPPSTAG